MRILPIAIAAALLPLAAACSTTDGYQKAVPPIFNLGPTSTVSGYLTKMDRMALPPDLVATITLSDISKQDVKAPKINEVQYSLTGVSVPFYFLINKPNQLPQNTQLGLRATIRDANGRLLYTTDSVIPVMTRPVDQDVGEIIMVRAGG